MVNTPMVNLYKGVGRNDPCPCGSGKKFKKCCLNSESLNKASSGLQLVDPQALEVARSALEQANGATIRAYDPLTEPHPEQWFALDEQERIDLYFGIIDVRGSTSRVRDRMLSFTSWSRTRLLMPRCQCDASRSD
jgi:hypothetical protein